MRSLLARLRDLFRRRSIARAFEQEMAFHLGELEQRYRDRGASPEEAREAAVREFGNVLQSREDLRARAGFPSWDELAGDCRFAWRGLARRPWLTVSIILILTLGLGAAATIYGLIDAVFLRPLPVPHPAELFAVVSAQPGAADRLSRGTVRRLEAVLPDRSVIAYGGGARCTVQIGALAAIRASTRLVNGAFFGTLGIGPAAGRLLEPGDDVPGTPARVTVVSHAWAAKNFGAVAAAIGRELVVNRIPITVVGVLPPGFRGVAVGQATDLWFATALQPALRIFGNASISSGDDRPNDPDWNRDERISWLQILLRVRRGTPLPAAELQHAWEPQRDDLIVSFDDPASRAEIKHRSWQLAPAPGGQSGLRGSFLATSRLLAGVVGVMLVLVGVNVSGLLLVRSMARHREIGVRLALGAGSFRVVRLGCMEAVLLCVAGGAGGWVLAFWLLPVAAHLLAPGQDLDTALGLRSGIFMSGLALGTATLSALAPAWWMSRVQPLNALAGHRGLGRAPVRFGRILVVVQFTIAVVLVAVAAALGTELQRVTAADPGFERDHIVTAVFDASSAGYDAEAALPLVERLGEVALGIPGVARVSFASTGILAGSQSASGIYVRDPQARVRQGHYQHDSVMPGYFDVIGVPVVLGRDFEASDKAGGLRVAIVNQAFARDVFGTRNPLGQSFGFGAQTSPEDWTIIGLVPDVRVNGVRAPAPPMFYTPASQWVGEIPEFMAIRFAGPEAKVQESLRSALARAEPGLVLGNWKTLRQRMDDDLSGDWVTTRLAAIFGACAVLIAGAGVAGSLGYLVILQQRELALRMAIGAVPGRVFRGVLGDALRLGALGSAAGIALVCLLPLWPVTKAVLPTTPGVGPALAAAAIALLAALAAGSIPARRAARIDPIQMLKMD